MDGVERIKKAVDTSKVLNDIVNIEKVEDALEYALEILMDQANKGYYPEAALAVNGGKGFKPIVDAIELFK